jgi:mannan endo-1,4-beta-mannosidase
VNDVTTHEQGMTPAGPAGSPRPPAHRKSTSKIYVSFTIFVAVVVALVITVVSVKPWATRLTPGTQSEHYLGVYEPDAPGSYNGIDQFAQAIGRQPNLVSYYSSWLEPFQTGFARTAAEHGALTVVQIDPENVSLASIAAGNYDAYLQSYAAAVKAFGGQLVLSFGHEMNGDWYSWADHRTAPAVFVQAWRHVVTVFRMAGASNVKWLWTVNVITAGSVTVANPGPWWPGSSYVNWVGLDGYYYSPLTSFAQVFAPTIVQIRQLTHSDPILISETGALSNIGQQAKITDLFSGVSAYDLLGFMWFDEDFDGQDWRITSPQALKTYRQDAQAYMRPVPSAK